MKKQALSVGWRLAALAITLPLLVACGQKGPLTLPQPADAASAPVKG
jgi:predicted small lipoprotein YifL